MEVFQARLDSFLKAKRVKQHSGTSGSRFIKWPHPSNFLATPNSLAEAGFYFCPTWEERDAVKCYICGKELSDWLQEDDPFAIHWEKCRTSCPWAILRCGLQDNIDRDGNFVFSDPNYAPSSEQMHKARLKTFTGWPHDSDKPHGATSERMALAGFVYTPQSPADDTATCLYCNIALNGWEVDDDPLKEHRKRDKKAKSRCPFLSHENVPPTVTTVKSAPKSRPKRLKAKSAAVAEPEKQASDEEATKLQVQKRRGTSPSADSAKASACNLSMSSTGPRCDSPREPKEVNPISTVIPPLSTAPVNKIAAVTEEELDMTVEEWIRREMDLQFGLFKSDGERMIDLFKGRTVEVRRIIQTFMQADTFQIKDLEALKQFSFDQILNEGSTLDPVTLLGTFPKTESTPERQPAILRIEKIPLSVDLTRDVCQSLLQRVELVGSNDIYAWFFGCLGPQRGMDVKISVICPATEVHIRKYTMQTQLVVRETPALYWRIVKPYIDALPPSRTQWVEDILSGNAESHNVLYDDPCQETGFVILPDMKWNLTTLSSLYLVAITRSKKITCLRDLSKKHLGILRSIRREAAKVVKEKWNFETGMIRLFIHYQPSYYHFHVHIVNANLYGRMGLVVGQAHLLDDVISLLELDPDDSHSIFERMTLTYGLGDQHRLFSAMKSAQAEFLEL